MSRLIDPMPAAWRERAEDLALLLLRLGFGGIMIYGHGWAKLTGFGEIAAEFPDPLGAGPATSLGLAVFAEVFCAAAVVLGLLTRWTLLPLIVTMVVAVFVVHADDPFRRQELGLLYLVAFVVLWLKGPGRWSIDARLRRSRSVTD